MPPGHWHLRPHLRSHFICMVGRAAYYYQLAVSSQVKIPNAHGGILRNRCLPNTITPLTIRLNKKQIHQLLLVRRPRQALDGRRMRLADRHYVTAFQLPDLTTSHVQAARLSQRAWGERASVATFMEQSSHPTAMYLNNAPNPIRTAWTAGRRARDAGARCTCRSG
jgi:hypothetical protein